MFTDPDGMVARTVVDSGHNLNDQFNKQIVVPALDILSLPVKAIDWATKTTSDERMAWAASSPFPADDVILGAIACLGKLPKVARAITTATTAPKSGTNAFRQGTFADEAADWGGNYVKGKQWAADNSLTTKGYAKKYGLPAENTGKPDWVVKGRVEGNYKTRPAPASHNNPANTGGGTEILPDNPNNVKLYWFHMPD